MRIVITENQINRLFRVPGKELKEQLPLEIERVKAELQPLEKAVAQINAQFPNTFWFLDPKNSEMRAKRVELHNKIKPLKEYLLRLLAQLESLKAQAVRNSTPTSEYTSSEDYIQKSIEKFGLTDNWYQAGYILPNGQMLNFGNGDGRGTDHRNIGCIFDYDYDERWKYIVDFQKLGAIRVIPESPGIDIMSEPTTEQYQVIKTIARQASSFYVDFSNERGSTDHSVYYDNPSPNKIEADIYRYYNEGITP